LSLISQKIKDKFIDEMYSSCIGNSAPHSECEI